MYVCMYENNPALLVSLMNRTQRQVWISLRALQTTETPSLLHNESFRVEERRGEKKANLAHFIFVGFLLVSSFLLIIQLEGE